MNNAQEAALGNYLTRLRNVVTSNTYTQLMNALNNGTTPANVKAQLDAVLNKSERYRAGLAPGQDFAALIFQLFEAAGAGDVTE